MTLLNQVVKLSKGFKLLYVEDDEALKKSLMAIFERLFDDIITACDGQDGLDKYRQNPDIDLVITDINMPNLDGLEMIRHIREDNTELPVLIFSAHEESEYFTKSIRLGISGYLIKPVELEQFLSVLHKVVYKLHLKDESEKNLSLLNQYQEATDVDSIISKTDNRGNITYVNQNFCDISGYRQDELIGKSHNVVRHPDNPETLFDNMWSTIKDKKQIWNGVVRNMTKSGKSYYVKSTIKPLLDKNGEIIEYISLRHDITDIMSHKKQLHDFIHYTKEVLVALIKIDGFNDIQKYFGQEIADTLESRFANQLMLYIPYECGFDKIYNLNNGQYAVARSLDDGDISIEKIMQKLKEFQKVIKDAKIDLDEFDYDISVALSVSYGKQDVLEDAISGLQQLDSTKQNFIVSNGLIEKEREIASENIRVTKMIKKAIESKKIVSFFQPIIDNKTQEVSKYESLVRLIDEDDKVWSPFFFLDVAKKGRYYPMITSMVLSTSFEALKHTDKDISINLSALDIEKESTRVKIYELLQEYKDDASRVVFELLEDEDVKDFSEIEKFINFVKSMGVKIAIDDFGAGYSNFERMLNYQPDIIKIDGSLVKNILTDHFSMNILQTLVTFAKKQDIMTVAEFVENKEIFQALKALDIDYSQGYYFGKPEKLN
jgi:PAS domain S-box-containing protein